MTDKAVGFGWNSTYIITDKTVGFGWDNARQDSTYNDTKEKRIINSLLIKYSRI